MTAKDLISPLSHTCPARTLRNIEADMPAIDVLPRLLDTPERRLAVTDGGETLGIIDRDSMLAGLACMIAARDDASVVTIECAPADYSATRLAHAVEDADANLVDLLTMPAADGRLKVTLRVSHNDPTATVHSLERYGYEVTDAHGADYADAAIADDRLRALQLYLNV